MFIFRKKPHVKFTIKLAGVPTELNVMYKSTKEFCRDYLTDEAPVFSVSVCMDDIDSERKIAVSDKDHFRRLSARDYETTALLRKLADGLINYNAVLIHGSVVALDGRAYMFTAPSGTGKTTHSKLWVKNIPDCRILNGDKPFVLFKDGHVYACSSPWTGKEKYGTNEILPLEAVCILGRGEENHIEKIKFKDAMNALLNQCHIPHGSEGLAEAVKLIKNLSEVRLYRLGCNTEDEAAIAAYNEMVK